VQNSQFFISLFLRMGSVGNVVDARIPQKLLFAKNTQAFDGRKNEMVALCKTAPCTA